MQIAVQYPMLKETVFLTQTDTTIGFVSQNTAALTKIKQRPPHKIYIKAVNSLSTLNKLTRTPSMHKKSVRRANKTTFIMPNGRSYRLIRDSHHLLLLDRIKWAYTTSANLSSHTYDETFAKEAVDIIITPLQNFHSPSTILKLGKIQQRRIR
jgi:tRNA A37 threonylcarbamoyladenosine synthetase subunit TsaC/SUA5/YrdC